MNLMLSQTSLDIVKQSKAMHSKVFNKKKKIKNIGRSRQIKTTSRINASNLAQGRSWQELDACIGCYTSATWLSAS